MGRLAPGIVGAGMWELIDEKLSAINGTGRATDRHSLHALCAKLFVSHLTISRSQQNVHHPRVHRRRDPRARP